MTHRTSLEVQLKLMDAAKLADEAQRAVFSAPGARDARHLVPADYQAAIAKARDAVRKLEAAVELMQASDKVQWVGPTGAPERPLCGPFVYNRHGERVAVSIPVDEPVGPGDGLT